MRIYLLVLSRTEGSLPEMDDIARHAGATLPFETGAVADATWTGERGTAAFAWHNEPDQPGRPLMVSSPGGASGFSGYAADCADGRIAEHSSGVWSTFSANEGTIRATTSASGTEMVFYAATHDLVVIGNRASLVHLVAHGAVDLDPVGLAAIVNAGFHTTSRTVFTGVTSLDPSTEVVGTAQGVVLRPLTTDDRDLASVDDVAQALLASVAGMPVAEPVRLGLTGGRDSRLLAALLARTGVPVLTRTAGSREDPDVVIAREVAEALGIPHTVQRASGTKRAGSDPAAGVVVDPRQRIREAVALGEGMLSAYDKVGRLHQTYDANLVPFSGSGGEILRGYYASALDGMELAEVARRILKRRAHPREKLLTPATRAEYLTDLTDWREWAGSEPSAALEAFYVRQRTARWSGVARGSSSTGSLAWRPFFDQQVVDTVRRTSMADRTSERLFADLLTALAPELENVRFAGKRWKFDAKAPSDPEGRSAWEARAPLVGSRGASPSFEWRTDSPEVRHELRCVLEEASEALWNVLDTDNIDRLFNQAAPSRADVVTMWHIATVAHTVTTRGGTTIDKHEPTASGTAITVSAMPPGPTSTNPTSALRTRTGGLARTALRRASRLRRSPKS